MVSVPLERDGDSQSNGGDRVALRRVAPLEEVLDKATICRRGLAPPPLRERYPGLPPEVLGHHINWGVCGVRASGEGDDPCAA